MAFLNDLSKKAMDVANTASDKARDAATLARLSLAIAAEQREIAKNCRTIGEWFVAEYSGEVPSAVQDLVDAVHASKIRIEELEAEKPSLATGASREGNEAEDAAAVKVCPVCGAISDSRFCPDCGAPMDDPAD